MMKNNLNNKNIAKVDASDVFDIYYTDLLKKNGLFKEYISASTLSKPTSDVITDINVIVPNKVVEVSFADDKKEKMVCHEEDTYNLRNCLFIAIAKHLYKKNYTPEGIEWKAFELTHLKKYVKIVDSALKKYEQKQEKIALKELDSKIEQERIERKRAKRQAYKERRIAKREKIEKEKQIEIQKEAYLRAMEVIRNEEHK